MRIFPPVRSIRILTFRNFLNRYMEKEVYKDFNEDVQFVTPDVTQLIKLYEGGAN